MLHSLHAMVQYSHTTHYIRSDISYIISYPTTQHFTSHPVTSYSIISHHITTHHITSYHITSYHITSRPVAHSLIHSFFLSTILNHPLNHALTPAPYTHIISLSFSGCVLADPTPSLSLTTSSHNTLTHAYLTDRVCRGRPHPVSLPRHLLS